MAEGRKRLTTTKAVSTEVKRQRLASKHDADRYEKCKYDTEYCFNGFIIEQVEKGNGKAIYGLDTALFGYNGTGSLVKNLTVWGQVNGDSNVGGIVGVLYAGGHITNCANFGAISTSHFGYSESGAAADIGGIVGLSYAPVSGCANYAQVTASSDSYGSSHAGGIAGQLNASPLTQCYNRGTVSAAHQAGGIVGTATGAEAVVTDCYSTGTITVIGTALNPQSGALVGTLMNSATLSNGYFLQGCYTYSKGSTSHTDEPVGYSATEGAWTAEKKLESEMKLDSFAIALSPEQRAFHMDSENKNDGYPVLSWQGGRVPELSQAEQDQGITSGTVLGGEGLISDATVRSIFDVEDGEEILGK